LVIAFGGPQQGEPNPNGFVAWRHEPVNKPCSWERGCASVERRPHQSDETKNSAVGFPPAKRVRTLIAGAEAVLPPPMRGALWSHPIEECQSSIGGRGIEGVN
jgi:hypothetical protein